MGAPVLAAPAASESLSGTSSPIPRSGSVWGCPQGPTLTGICSFILEALEQRLHEGALCWSRGGGRECVC